ncbi:Imm49 family immunity protein [Archangium lansingense]|uniref:Imm49 family immunity protein n=1 Tax=Archangium lansingense TaxID=2995310 RepID=UPI003B7A5ED4
MSSQYLPVYVGNALNENLDWLPELMAGTVGRKRILAFCQNFRIAGIGELLMTGLADEFVLRLHQSGSAYVAWLRNAAAGEKRTGQSPPFFDAIASGDLRGAADIARLSKRSWTPGAEYEEDFLFVEFLMQRFFLGASTDMCVSLLQRYEKALKGTEDPRLEVCAALQGADAEQFNKSMQLFLSEWRDRYAQLAEEGGIAPELQSTDGKLCVEGVALARLAEGLGLETEEDYLLVPSVAREEVSLVFRANSWTDL